MAAALASALLTPPAGATPQNKEGVPPAPPRIGPFKVQSEDGNWSLSPHLAVQLLLSVQTLEPAAGDSRETDVRLKFRRIRPMLRGNAINQRLRYYFHLSTAPGSLEFMDMLLDYRFHEHVQLRAGQHKLPFTRYRIQSFKNLTVADWSIFPTYMGAERQIGLTLHNGYERPPAWEYEFGVYTGTNARAAHAVALARTFGETVDNPSDLTDPAPLRDIHPELVAHLAYNHAGIDVSTDTDWTGGPPRFSTGLSVAWDIRPDPIEDLQLRLAAEGLMKLYGLSAMAMGFVSFFDSTMEANKGTRLAFYGAQVQASYMMLRRLEVAARYTVVWTDPDLRFAAQDHGWQRVFAASDPAEKQALLQQYARAGRVELDQEVAAGLNVYIIGRSLKWQNDAVLRLRTTAAQQEQDFTFRSQVTLAF